MQLHVFEDNAEGLYPFSTLHCSWELRCGPSRIIDLWTKRLQPASINFQGRTAHIASFLARFPQYVASQKSCTHIIAVRSSLLPTQQICQALLQEADTSCCFIHSGRIVAIRCSVEAWEKNAVSLDTNTTDIPADYSLVDVNVSVIDNIWQALDLVELSILDQTIDLYHPCVSVALAEQYKSSFVSIVGPERVYLGTDVSISSFSILDASEGPIIIGDNVRIMAHTMICGPCFIGANTLVKAGAKIYSKTVIGEWCKVGGEIENSILHAFSNKQHEGFLGHSFLSEWVNLGADTNTSDLKNTYAPIRITRNSQQFDTGRMFLGLLCGDHSKSGIDTMFNTGTVCGIHANVFGAGYTSAEIASYSWGAIQDTRVYPLKKALAVARTVMLRRAKELCPEEEVLMSQEFHRLHSTS